ncbi:MAG: signal transduction histidine kinase [bacterium]|jgi:signal transduction histidine kinase
MKKSILVIDDNKNIVKLIERYFSRKGYQIFSDFKPTACLNILRNESIDIILLDQMMPEYTGVEVFDIIHEKIASPPPVIMITAHSSLQLATIFMKQGGADFVQKPIEFEILEVKMKNAMEKNILRKELIASQIALQAEIEVNLAKSQLINNVSHELYTPLHSILGFTDLGIKLSNEAEFDQKITFSDYFKNIKKSGNRLMNFVNDLIDLSQLEAKQIQFSMTSCNNLEKIVQNVLHQNDHLIQKKNLHIKTSITTSTPNAQFDQKWIHKVIVKLLINAINYSGLNKSIYISIHEIGHFLKFSISDEGIGIPTQELESIFEKFTQSSKTLTGAGGTGLGLSICKAIITAHKGKIWAENHPKGSIFCFMLPISQEGKVEQDLPEIIN